MKIRNFYQQYSEKTINGKLFSNDQINWKSIMFNILMLVGMILIISNNKFPNIWMYLIIYAFFIIAMFFGNLLFSLLRIPNAKNFKITQIPNYIKKRKKGVFIDKDLKTTMNLLHDNGIKTLEQFDELVRYNNNCINKSKKRITTNNIVAIIGVIVPLLQPIFSIQIEIYYAIFIIISLYIIIRLYYFIVIVQIYEFYFSNIDLKKELAKDLEILKMEFI